MRRDERRRSDRPCHRGELDTPTIAATAGSHRGLLPRSHAVRRAKQQANPTVATAYPTAGFGNSPAIEVSWVRTTAGS